MENETLSQRQPFSYETILFFFSGVGGALCYISTLSSVVYFSHIFGPRSFIILNIAVYFPLLPLSLFQAKYDQSYDIRYGSFATFLFRGIVGFALNIISIAMIPFVVLHTEKLRFLVMTTVVLGTASAVLQNLYNSITAVISSRNFSPTGNNNDGKKVFKAAESTGNQASAIISLIVSLYTGFGRDTDSSGLKMFFYSITILELFMFISFLSLMYNSQIIQRSMIRRDSNFMFARDSDSDNDLSIGLLSHNQEEELTDDVNHVSLDNIDLTYSQVWDKSWISCLTLLLTLIPSFLVGSWFPFVKTSNISLPQTLFFTRMISGNLSMVRVLNTISCCFIFIEF